MDKTTKNAAYLKGYMSKSAGFLDRITGAATGAASWGLDKAVLAALAAPLAAGVGAGAIASHVTSPGSTDRKIIQNKLHSLELQEFRTELERRKKLAAKKGINESEGEVNQARSLRI